MLSFGLHKYVHTKTYLPLHTQTCTHIQNVLRRNTIRWYGALICLNTSRISVGMFLTPRWSLSILHSTIHRSLEKHACSLNQLMFVPFYKWIHRFIMPVDMLMSHRGNGQIRGCIPSTTSTPLCLDPPRDLNSVGKWNPILIGRFLLFLGSWL